MTLTGHLNKILLSAVLTLGLSVTALAQHGGGGHGGGGGGGGHAGGGGGGGHVGGGAQHGGGSAHVGGGGQHGGSAGHVGGGAQHGGGAGHVGSGVQHGGSVGGHGNAGHGNGNVGHGNNNVGHNGGRSAGTIHGANGHSARVPASVSRGGRNYSQRVVNHGGRQFVERSYGGHRGYYGYNHWGRYGYYGYCHNFGWGWGVGFWGWYGLAWAPWYYSWGWYTSPWYGYWGWYYHPYAYYVGASYFVTDYVLSQELQDEYDRGYNAGEAAQRTSTPITDADKEQVRQQVDSISGQLKAEQTLEIQNAFKDPKFLFIADTDLSVTPSNSSAACKVAGGDIIKVAAAAPTENDATAQMVVVTSKGGSCPAGTQITVSISDLQEMLNTFGEKVDAGLQDAQKHKNEIKTAGH